MLKTGAASCYLVYHFFQKLYSDNSKAGLKQNMIDNNLTLSYYYSTGYQIITTSCGTSVLVLWSKIDVILENMQSNNQIFYGYNIYKSIQFSFHTRTSTESSSNDKLHVSLKFISFRAYAQEKYWSALCIGDCIIDLNDR